MPVPRVPQAFLPVWILSDNFTASGCVYSGTIPSEMLCLRGWLCWLDVPPWQRIACGNFCRALALPWNTASALYMATKDRTSSDGFHHVQMQPMQNELDGNDQQLPLESQCLRYDPLCGVIRDSTEIPKGPHPSRAKYLAVITNHYLDVQTEDSSPVFSQPTFDRWLVTRQSTQECDVFAREEARKHRIPSFQVRAERSEIARCPQSEKGSGETQHTRHESSIPAILLVVFLLVFL
jgi:hypothetical protein